LDQATIFDLALRLDLNAPSEITVTLARVDFVSADSPPEVIQGLMTKVLQMDLCHLLDGPTIGDTDVIPAQGSGPESSDVEPRKGFTCSYL
jgi:hypothetical protein